MGRIDLRVLVLLPVLLIAGGCGDDEPEPPPPVSSAPAVAPSLTVPSAEPSPDDSVYVEEDPQTPDPDPTTAAGELGNEAQAFLDEAIGLELGSLEGAPAETAAPRRKILDALPDDPRQVLGALKNYVWYSPEARAQYDKAVKAG